LESDEEFHDASDKMNNDSRSDDRKSNSSHTGSVCEEADRALFDAEIVTPSAASVQYNAGSRPLVPRVDHQSVAKRRRTRIPDRPQVSLNLWSIMRNCIGKELSKIPMPVNFNEPLSVLQRISEDLEYSYLLDMAADCSDSLEQMCYIAAYAVSSYSTTGNRTTKPFNPLLGETFECDRMADLGWKSLAEQVSHHPPITAHHADGRKWTVHQDFTMTSRFRGKYLSVIPIGYSHVQFRGQKNIYSFKKVTTTVHNIIVGKLWIDNHGEMVIDNHATGDKCFLKFHPYSYFSREIPRKVTGLVKNSKGKVEWIIQGTWDKSLDMLRVIKDNDNKGEKSVFETGPPLRMWTVNPPYPNCEKMYYFTKLAVELNEPEVGVAPTDSRLRPDQRKAQHEPTGAVIHMFTGEYWEKKKLGDWSICPNIF
uniref:Oxysterol-binding protein n=1 Tax=Anisakis simplex TaxID=6269 RepID=A0A0M3K554_ANISI